MTQGQKTGEAGDAGMIKFDVLNRFSGKVQFTAEIDCQEDAPPSIKLGLAVKWATSARANLADAYLAGANLARANLADANLAGAYLAGAYLADANLAGANLAGANLASAYLAGAYLAGAYLAGAYLAGAYHIIALGYPNGWPAWSYRSRDGIQRVRVGCRDFTIAEGRSYWAGKSDRMEVVAALDYAEQIGKLREWEKPQTQTSVSLSGASQSEAPRGMPSSGVSSHDSLAGQSAPPALSEEQS